MIDNDTIDYRTRELAKAAPRDTFHPNLVVIGPDGRTKHLPITPAEYFRVIEALTTDPGIAYRVQAHDITTLTEAMWDACGIECPAMIGAPCPGGMGCPGWSPKWDNAATEVVYGWTMESFQSETCGDVDQPIGCNHLFRTPEDERHDDNPMGAGLILNADSQGFVALGRYENVTELDENWAQLQEEEAKFERANCPACAESNTPCDEHGDEDEAQCEDFCGLHIDHDGPCKEN